MVKLLIYDLATLVRFQLDLIINIEIICISLALISIIYSLFNYNPMYSLLFFILFLFNNTFLLILQNCEFIALLLGLIYFGAILILFFFVILLINLQVVTRDNLHIKKIPLVLLILGTLLIFFLIVMKSAGLFTSWILKNNNNYLSLENLSFTLFNNFSVSIIILGLILFLTLIGIVLILVNNKNLNLKYLRKSI